MQRWIATLRSMLGGYEIAPTGGWKTLLVGGAGVFHLVHVPTKKETPYMIPPQDVGPLMVHNSGHVPDSSHYGSGGQAACLGQRSRVEHCYSLGHHLMSSSRVASGMGPPYSPWHGV